MIEDKCKQLVEMAIASGRKRLSPQTGYVHHCYHALEDETQYPIPVVENALFALALLRSKTMENMNEGKALIERLLPFQTKEGNFPVYLHDYPVAKDRFLGVHLLPVFYWISKHFNQILGAELKAKLEQSSQRLLDYCLKTESEITPPPHLGIKIAAAAKAFGRSNGDELLKKNKIDTAVLGCPTYLGDFACALQMVDSSLQNSSWSHFWDHINHTWHKPSCAFIGPAVKEAQQGYEPQVTLYDLYMGVLSGQFASRVLVDSPIHLQGALIQPTGDKLHSNENPYAYSVLSYDVKPPQHQEKMYHPLKIVWGTPKRTHSFVMQGGNADVLRGISDGNKIEFMIDLGPMVNVEDRESSREVSFYFDVAEDTVIKIDDEASNTFSLGQVVKISYAGLNLKLKMELVEGEGHFFGHLMRGNRPSQIALKGNHRFKAYDWTLFLRTLRRSEKCQLKVRIELE